MGMNKKGIFFIMIAILIISIFAVSFVVYETIKNRDSVQKRISTMNNFILSVEKDLQRQMYISGFRAIFVIEKDILETGSFSTNINQTFEELFFNGTINQKPQEIMAGATFSDIQTAINLNSNKMNVVINLSSPEVFITQTDAWHVQITLIANFRMADKGGLASWDKVQVIESFVPIEGFEDPLYALSTNNLVTNNITKTPFAGFTADSNITNLSIHSTNSFYKESETAPSFLDRLSGMNTPSQQGIESLVNLQKLSSQGLQIEQKSVVDYIYFSSDNPSSNHISGMPSWFRLDSNHLFVYNSTLLVD